MSNSQCAICGQGNPESAKFCNECGAPLRIPERQPMAAAEPTDSEWLLDFEPSTIGGFEKQRQRAQNAPVRLGLLPRRTPQVVTDLVDLFAHERTAAAARSLPSSARSATTTARRSAMARVALPILAVAIVAIAAYVAYRHPAPSTAKVESPVTAPSIETRAPIETSTQGRIRTTDIRGNGPAIEGAGDSQTSSPSIAAGAASSTAAEQTHASESATKPKSAKAQTRDQTPARRSAPAPVATTSFPDADTLAIRAPVRNARDNADADGGGQRVCTDQVAALGLCRRDGEGNR